MAIILALAAAYLVGSVPLAYLMGRWIKHIDIRQVGSKNMGTMNTFYEVGFLPGLLVMTFDIGKGAVAIAIARALDTPQLVELLAGVFAVLGHVLPVWLKFKGGKGGATCIGALVFLMPWGVPIYAAAFGLFLLITRFPTFSYSAAFVIFPVIGWLIYHSVVFVIYPAVLLAIPGFQYIVRVKQIGEKSTSLKDAIFRKSLRDRR
ncbi:glycerol-3-phosphate acyltransferase PlsY [Dehalogenimonas formicexedens]|uniref:Glycerol-3-phosphate acyltransferase n=1 Tax=Dehalogenimonas formicexedens TaxID=1839801 RepID=A0A1P8F6Z7_9CHLR|nr:glycerol-3-phosphate acyltransferase [Dehalogenimonas formicexedens]APV44122.1 glycerol-3-phosphate acyltransferase PlsY [Dehalogenimonas formicexedens]